MDQKLVKRLLELRERIVSHFDNGDWIAAGMLADKLDLIEGHRRLLRSLEFQDSDYSSNVLEVLREIEARNPNSLTEFETYLDEKYPDDSHYVSAKPSEKKLTFAPHVFNVVDFSLESDLAAVMMPFAAEFNGVRNSISSACGDTGYRCVRADDIWDEPTIIQDIFNLILKARVVIVDFTGKNPNVMYETGIAHTLGKLVLPITQSIDDVPFDLRHHRVLKYLPNGEGLKKLRKQLADKLGKVDV